MQARQSAKCFEMNNTPAPDSYFNHRHCILQQNYTYADLITQHPKDICV